MENRKSLRLFIFISVFIFTLGITPSALAYGADTHAYLTDEVVKFYNQHYGNNQISADLKSYIIDGSRREDDVPRWLNHFYDPVNNQGLNDPEWGKGFSAKEWAQSDSKQTTYAYKPISYIASILSSAEQEEINGMDLNYTWQQAIRYYRNGEIEKAMFALGHVLHLIEDASVPDHTRNDGHPEPLGDGSPYETFTERFTLGSPDKDLKSRLSGKKPFDSMPMLSSYFNELANYSNNNFYSADTLSLDIYNEPNADYSKIEGKYNYEFRSDLELGDHKLAIIVSDPLYLVNKRILAIKGENDGVLNDYWSRLSTKSVQVSAGVIKLFFDDIERVNYGDTALIKDDRNPMTKLVDNARAWAQIVFSSGKVLTSSTSNITREAWDNTFGNTGSDEKLVEVIDTNDTKGTKDTKKTDNVSVVEVENSADLNEVGATNNENDEEVNEQPEEPAQKKDDVLVNIEQPKKAVVQDCAFNTSQLPSHKNIILNEAAWMGGDSAFGLTSSDEWVELKNISGAAVNLSGWQVLDQGEQIKIKFDNGVTVPAGGFYLLERTDDNSVSNVAADFIYSGALSNTNEGLRLFDSQCDLIDEVLANPDWPAGDSTSKRTMEREANLNWHTFGGDASGGVWGTPKRENGQALVQSNAGGGGGGATTSSSQSGSNVQNSDNKNQEIPNLIINEIMYDLAGSDSGREWIEVKNIGSLSANVSNLKLYENQTNHALTSVQGGLDIPAGGFFIIADDTSKFLVDNPTYNGILFNSSFSLNNTGEALALKNIDTIVNEVIYSSAPGAQGDGNSLQLINNTWQATLPTPGRENVITSLENGISQDVADEAPLLQLEILEVVYNPDGADEGEEFIIINNPNDIEIDLSAYSVQYLGSSGDFSDIKKKNFEAASKIPGRGIFKIGMNCHTNTPCENVDLSWSQVLNNASGTVFLVSNQELLTGLSDSDIVDGFHYPEVTQLAEPNNFITDYNPDKLEINLTWEGESTLVYQVQEYNSPGVTIFEGTGNSFSKRIDEVGKNYKFSIRAFNENAEYTELVEKEITAPTFIKDVHFYNSTHYTYNSESQDNLIEFSYDSYPFLPLDLVYAPWGNPDTGPTYKALVFYLNAEAPKRAYLNGASPLTEDLNSVLKIKYDTCAGGGNPYVLLLLPDTSEQCNLGSGFGNSSINYYRYLAEGDKYLLLSTDGSFGGQSVFTESDYFTIAFYGFERDFPQGTAPMNGIYPNFKLLAVDKTKYYFNNPPNHEPPQLTGEITLNFDKQNSRLNVSWPSATDSDTLDNLLTYEIKYASSDDWQLAKAVYSATDTTKIVSAGDNFSISVRAKDDFGNYSAPDLTAEWSYPATDFSFIQGESNAWSYAFGQRDGLNSVSISLQSIAPTNDFQFDKVSLRVKQSLANDYTNLKLSVYPDNNSNNQPDFSSVVASSVIHDLYNPDGDLDITFHFDSPVSFSAASKYWFALEVEDYSWPLGWGRNAWQNAVSDASSYSQGEAARIRVVGGVYSYNDFIIEPENDWYMKIGLEQ